MGANGLFYGPRNITIIVNSISMASRMTMTIAIISPLERNSFSPIGDLVEI